MKAREKALVKERCVGFQVVITVEGCVNRHQSRHEARLKQEGTGLIKEVEIIADQMENLKCGPLKVVCDLGESPKSRRTFNAISTEEAK